MDINIYKFDKDLQIIELGKGTFDKVSEILEESLSKSHKNYKYGEDAIAETTIGLSKTEEDFIEVSCHGDDEITIHTDRLIYDSKWSNFFHLKNIY